MSCKLTVSFRHCAPSAGATSHARALGTRLCLLDGRITACHITVQGPLKEAWHIVRVQLTLANALLHTSTEYRSGIAHCDVYVAIHDAFADARRQLDSLSRSRGEAPLMGNFPDDD